MTEKEIWKDVVGYEGLYKVSNRGNIYSVERISSQGNKCGGRTLSPAPHSHGYLQVGLHKNGIKKNKFIHRLVAEAFLPNPNNFLEVNHLDEIKDNNYVENLEWCTRKYNMNYGARNEKDARRKYKKVRAINVETGEVLAFNSAKEAHGKGYPGASKACRGIYTSGSGNLIGDGRTYKGHRWYYDQ